MKRMISAILAVVMLIGMLPINAFATSDSDYIEVTKSRAPIRTKADGDADVFVWVEKGTVLESVDTCLTWKLTQWHKVRIPGETRTYFIYDGNVEDHRHQTTDLNVNGIVYRICACGNITADTSGDEQKEEADEILMSTSLVLPMTMIDGPLPVVDLAAASILILGTCISLDYAVPAVEELAELITEADFSQYLEDRLENVCTEYTFRRVDRFKGGLKYLDDYCMDPVEAYLYVRMLKGDVYTRSEDSALMLAAMFGAGIMERDKARPNKDISTYYFHFHVGVDRKNKAHIFFGVNDRGEMPV